MTAEFKSRLEALRADYAAVKGLPFEYLYCPFLFQDEDVPLCEGHVLNRIFGVATNIWLPQRRDIDAFFGSRFEADLTKLRYRGDLGAEDVLGDPKLRRKLRPRVLAGNRRIDYFIPQSEIPDKFTAVYSDDDALPPVIGLKIHPRELENAIDADWRIEVELDLRVGSFVSLLKAAHLTQFYLFGYRYVLSPAGHLVGKHLLGRIFEECRTTSRNDAQRFAATELSAAVNMVRPLVKTELDLSGTVLDRQVLVAWGASGFPWATIVIVPAGDTLHGVMLPVGDHVEGVATWHQFMSNENESIAVKLCRFEPELEGGIWELSKASWRIQWPKGAALSTATGSPA